MEKRKTSNRYSPEMRARAVRMVLEHQGSHETQSAAVAAIAPKIGCIPETLRVWVRQAEKDSGARGLVRPAQSVSGSKNWNVKCVSFGTLAQLTHGDLLL